MTANTSLAFNIAQNFWIEPNIKDTTKVKVTGFDLFFKYKPAAINNRSGIQNPGISVYLTDTIYDVPLISEKTFNQVARVEWASIFTSSDASMPTRVTFPDPIACEAGKKYSIVIAFDGDEAFWPWVAKIGMWLWGTRTIYTGLAGNLVGEYYEYTSSDTHNDPTTAQDQTQYRSYWRALADTTLKFSVFAARYYIDGVPVSQVPDLDPSVIIHSNNLIQTSNGIGQLTLWYPAPCMEQVTFDLANSTVSTFVGAQRVFQNTVFFPGGYSNGATFSTLTCNNSDTITAGTIFPNGTPFNWNTIFGGYTGQKYITLFDQSLTNVRLVRSILSNTVIQVTEPVTFTNVATKFMISPIATVDSFDMNSPRGKKTEFMRMTGSNANSTVRFVNNCIETIAVANGGGLYKNSDILYIKGFANIAGKVTGGYVAVANIVTDGAGSITNVYVSNQGCGFANNGANIVAVVSTANQAGNITANSTTGVNAIFTYTVGATLKTELTNNIFKNCSFVNLDMEDASPFFDVFTPPGTTFSLSIETGYYLAKDTSTPDGYAYYVYPGGQEFNDIQLMKRNRFIADYVPVFMSYSNEFNTLYLNGTQNDTVNALSVTSNNFILAVHTTSNSDWVTVTVDTTPTVELGKYIINNDYTLEETDTGNCWAKHVTTRNYFARLSEDVRVTLEAFKPANTDIQVYCRIQNSGDPDAFDDANWTRLQLIDGMNMVSSINNEADYVELTYGFQSYPNTAFTLSGFVSTSDNSAIITGTSTTFSSNLAVNNMVRIYDPLYPGTNYLVATVTAIASNTSLTIDQPVLASINPALIQNGMKIDKLDFIHQAYTNITNDNVVRYYNTSIVKYDGYDTLQIKVLLLSSHLNHIPRMHSLRGLGVSA